MGLDRNGKYMSVDLRDASDIPYYNPSDLVAPKWHSDPESAVVGDLLQGFHARTLEKRRAADKEMDVLMRQQLDDFTAGARAN